MIIVIFSLLFLIFTFLVLAYNNMRNAVQNYQHLTWAFLFIILCHLQKIEVIDEDEEDDDYNVELMASDLEQMQSLLEFKVNATCSGNPFWRAKQNPLELAVT